MQAAVLNIPDIRAEAEAKGRSYGFRILADELRPPCCMHLGAEGHHLGRSRFVRSLHTVEGRPIMLEERHVFLDTVPAAAEADFDAVPPGSWLIAHVPWTEAEHRVSATGAEPEVSDHLGLPRGAACLVPERCTRRGAATVTIVRQVFRGEAIGLTASFSPGTHGAAPGDG